MRKSGKLLVESPIKLNLKQPVTVDDVRKLLASVEDDRTWQLVITYNGTAYLCDRDEVENRQPKDLHDFPDGVSLGDPRLAESVLAGMDTDTRLLKDGSDLIYIRFESFSEGNNYVGPWAAQDETFVKRLHAALIRNWPQPEHGFNYIDSF